MTWNQRMLQAHAPQLSSTADVFAKKLREEIKSGAIGVEERSQCLCGGTLFELLCTADRFGLEFSSVLCRKCGLICTSPYILEKYLPYYYDQYYHGINYGLEQIPKGKIFFKKHQGRYIFERMKIKGPGSLSVLEIGAGTGTVLIEFQEEAQKQGLDVHLSATEFSAECVEHMCTEEIAAVQGGPDDLSGKVFDVIVLSHVLEHVVDIEKFLLSIKHLMHERSILYVEVPGIMTLHEKPEYNSDFRFFTIHAHVYNFNLTTLRSVMQMNGFRMHHGDEIAYGVFSLGQEGPVDYEDNVEKITSYLISLESRYGQNK